MAALDDSSAIEAKNGLKLNFPIVAAAAISSPLILTTLFMCACCARKKRRQREKSTIEGTVKGADASVKSGTLMNAEMENDALKTIMQLQDESMRAYTVPAMPVVTVITSEPKSDVKNVPAKAAPPLKKPAPEAVRFDDPAYRTIGRDVDDPFVGSLSMKPEKSKKAAGAPIPATSKKVAMQAAAAGVKKSLFAQQAKSPPRRSVRGSISVRA